MARDAVAERREIVLRRRLEGPASARGGRFRRRLAAETAAARRRRALPLRHARLRRAGRASAERANPGEGQCATTAERSVVGRRGPRRPRRPPRSNRATPTPERAPRVAAARASASVSGASPSRRRNAARSPAPAECRSQARHGRELRSRRSPRPRASRPSALADAARRRAGCARAPGARTSSSRASRSSNAGLEGVDGEADRPEPPAKIAVRSRKPRCRRAAAVT